MYELYITLYKVHKVVVFLFLLIYLVKTVLLLANKDLFDKVNKYIKLPEIVVSAAFLLTGVGMLFGIAEIKPLFVAKIVVVLAAIPIAVIGFKRKNRLIATFSFVLIVASYGMAEVNKRRIQAADDLPATLITDATHPDYSMVAHGMALYKLHCVNCHGEKGDRGLSGAKNLAISTLSLEEVQSLVHDGKNNMPPYKKFFTEHEMRVVSEYAMSLRTAQ